MTVAANKEALRHILAAYAVGDQGPALARLDDNFVWTVSALPGHFRFGGTRRGRAGAIETLSLIAADYTIHRYEVVEMVAEGDVIWTLSKVQASQRRSGKDIFFMIAGRWQFRDGKILSATEHFDSASVLAQQGDIPEVIRA